MFQNLKNLFTKVNYENNDEIDIIDEEIHAALCLFIEASKIDGEIDKNEFSLMNSLLVNKFHLNEIKAQKAIDFVIEKEKEKVEIYSDIKVILDRMDHQQRIEIIEMLWRVVLADSKIDDYETNLIRKISSLLHISAAESTEAKKRAMN